MCFFRQRVWKAIHTECKGSKQFFLQKCSKCRKHKDRHINSFGATAGCAIPQCNKTYHYYCAVLDKNAITARMEVFNKFSGRKTVKYR